MGTSLTVSASSVDPALAPAEISKDATESKETESKETESKEIEKDSLVASDELYAKQCAEEWAKEDAEEEKKVVDYPEETVDASEPEYAEYMDDRLESVRAKRIRPHEHELDPAKNELYKKRKRDSRRKQKELNQSRSAKYE